MSLTLVDIRNETPDDVETITEATKAAFQSQEISIHTEQFVIEALRFARALTASLVAEANRGVFGHIAFSPVSIMDGKQGWCGLGPVSSSSGHHCQGLGKATIREGLSQLINLHGRDCRLVGHPEYYKKFGFDAMPDLVFEGVPPEVLLALPFDECSPWVIVTFHGGFRADSKQDAGKRMAFHNASTKCKSQNTRTYAGRPFWHKI